MACVLPLSSYAFLSVFVLCLCGGSFTFSFSSLVCDDIFFFFLVMGYFELTPLEAKDLVFLLLAFMGCLEFSCECVSLVYVVFGQMGLSSLLYNPFQERW